MLLVLDKDHRNLPWLLSSKMTCTYCKDPEAALVVPRHVGFSRVTGVQHVWVAGSGIQLRGISNEHNYQN